MTDRNRIAASVAFTIAITLAICSYWITFATFESEAFNRITGANVTTWDAMFLDLRVLKETNNQKE